MIAGAQPAVHAVPRKVRMSRRQGSVSTPWGSPEPAKTRPAPVVKPREDRWASKYVTRVRWTDAVIVAAAVLAAQLIRFGSAETLAAGMSWKYLALTGCLFAGWTLALRATQSSDRRIVGDGPTEYSRVLNACFIVFGLLAIVDLAFRLSVARGSSQSPYRLGLSVCCCLGGDGAKHCTAVVCDAATSVKSWLWAARTRPCRSSSTLDATQASATR